MMMMDMMLFLKIHVRYLKNYQQKKACHFWQASINIVYIHQSPPTAEQKTNDGDDV